MEEQNELFAACRLLFGEGVSVSTGFLEYLRKEGIDSAFRRRAKELHPDKVCLSGVSVRQAHEDFIALRAASEILTKHVIGRANRPAGAHRKKHSAVSQRNSDWPDGELRFGRFLCHKGIIGWDQLTRALSRQRHGRPKIGELGVRYGYLSRDSVPVILRNMKSGGKFGVSAYRLGYLEKEEVSLLLSRQRSLQKKIGHYLVEDGLLGRGELETLLRYFRRCHG